MAEPPIITLLTDFGADSPYVAQMKGVILSICRQANIVDLTHSIPPQNVFIAAHRWQEAVKHFPSDAIHVAVVDPGVGTDRRIVAVQSASGIFIAPDNGLLGFVCSSDDYIRAHQINNTTYRSAKVSATFHGRDIMGPAAAHIANGLNIAEMGDEIPAESVVLLETKSVEYRDDEIVGEVVDIDTFGNLITQIQRSDIPPDRRITSTRISGSESIAMVHSYGHAKPGSIVALFGSSDLLEIACVNGNAQQRLQINRGEQVTVITALEA